VEATTWSEPEELRAALSALLEGHGINTGSDGDWLTFPGRQGKIQGLIFDLKNVHPFVSTQVDCRFSPWPGCLICESFAGMGETREARIQNALEAFVSNSLHVLLKVFLGADCHERTNPYTITNHGVRFTVTDGHALLRANAAASPGTDWFKGFQELLETRPLPEGTHWIRIYYAQLDGKPSALELLLDGRTWADAMPAARGLAWPRLDGFLSLRLFLVLQGGVDVGQVIGLIAGNAHADDKRLEEIVVAAGLTTLDAKRLNVLIPIAFGGRLLENLGINPSTVCQIDDGRTRTTVDLASSHLFQQARTIAATALADGSLSRDEFLALAGRDASLQAVNSALLAGSQPSDLRLAPTTILWTEAAPLCTAPEREEPPKRNPWWRMWR
jgi:hypothetical protein